MDTPRVIVAFSYDTEMAAPTVLPERIIAPAIYSGLGLSEKKKVWADYLGTGLWDDENQLQWSIQELETVSRLADLFEKYGGTCTSFVLGTWLDFMVEGLG